MYKSNNFTCQFYYSNYVFQLSQTLAELKITDYEINSNDIEKGDKLGRGAFADVFRLIMYN